MNAVSMSVTPATARALPPGRSIRQLFLWCLPALLVGGILRLWIIQGWGPAFYFGPDSSSYWHPVFRFFHQLPFTISEKRPWFYSTLMLLTPLGPKSPAFTAGLLQHFIGLLAALPLAAIVRMTMPRWKLWVVPLTLGYVINPQMLYWEHVMIADSLFVALAIAVVWAFCWFWHSHKWGVLGLVLALLFIATATRPVGRALWLSMLPLSFLLPGASWRKKGIACALLAGLYFPASKLTHVNQDASLFFTSAFPLIETQSPLHAEIKRELAPAVNSARADLWGYVSNDQRDTWTWLGSSNASHVGPCYAALVANRKERARVTGELTREAVLHHPFTYASMVGMKIYAIVGLNTRAFRFEPKIYQRGSEKFLSTTLKEIDPRFPSFILGDTRAQSPEGISAVIRESLSEKKPQSRFLSLLPYLTACTSLYSWAEPSPTPCNYGLLIVFLVGIGSLAFVPEKRNFLPIIVLGLGYLALTLVVGRAVGRYRLPAEFFLLIMTFQGCDALWQLAKHSIDRLKARAPQAKISNPT